MIIIILYLNNTDGAVVKYRNMISFNEKNSSLCRTLDCVDRFWIELYNITKRWMFVDKF
jgi:hypothetical protein